MTERGFSGRRWGRLRCLSVSTRLLTLVRPLPVQWVAALLFLNGSINPAIAATPGTASVSASKPVLARESVLALEAQPTLEQAFARFLAWFPGRYDSALQTRLDALEQVPEASRNYRRHSIFRRVDLPAFGEVVFYAEQYRDGDPEQVYRQRLYVFTLAPERDAFRLRVHVPHGVIPLRGAYREPGRLQGLTPEQTTVWNGCDLYWRWEGNHFRGALDPGACRFQSEAFGQEIVLDEYLLLYEDAIHFADRGLALDGGYLFGMRGETPNISKKARPFLCRLSQGARAWTEWIHDQGGAFELEQGRVELQRWNYVSSASDAINNGRRTLRLTLRSPEGDGIAEATAPVGAERIELNMGAAAASCRHVPAAVYDDDRQAQIFPHTDPRG